MRIDPRALARWNGEKMTKVAAARTERCLVDVYCLAPGQSQRPHAHAGEDKVYVVLEGRARVEIAGSEELLEPGQAALAPAGVAHGIANATESRLLVLVVVAPPPPHAA